MQPDEVVDLFNNIIGQVAPEYFQEPEPNPIGFREDLKTKVYDKLLEMGGTMYRGMGAAYNRDDDMPQYNDEYDEEGAYDTDAERLESGMAEKEAMEDLADKFNVQVTFAKTIDNKDIAIVTHENNEVMGYMDEEEMYQDLASRHEMSEEVIAALKNV